MGIEISNFQSENVEIGKQIQFPASVIIGLVFFAEKSDYQITTEKLDPLQNLRNVLRRQPERHLP